MGLIVFFGRFIAGGWQFRPIPVTAESYTVYIIHIPIIVFVVYAAGCSTEGNLLKFGLASIIVPPLLLRGCLSHPQTSLCDEGAIETQIANFPPVVLNV